MVLFCLLFVSAFTEIHSQQALVASGTNISGGGASASYSVGQVVQSTNSVVNGSTIQGIQFYFEDVTLTIIDLDTNMEIATYPNPTSSFINVKIPNKPNAPLSYTLYNVYGAVVLDGKITDSTTKIEVNHLPIATYLLKVNNSNTTIKTFKIIKN